MDSLGDLLILVATMALLLGILVIVRPVRSLGFSRRRDGILIIVAAVAVSALAHQVSPDLKARSERRAATARTERQQAEAARKQDDLRGDLNRQNRAAAPDGIYSSGGCRTDALGNARCDYDATAKFGSYSGSSSLSTTCRTNPVNGQYECKSEMSTR